MNRVQKLLGNGRFFSYDIREHEDRTAPSECDLAHAIPHGSSDLALKMSLMEKRLGSMELLHRDKPANYVVVEALEGLNLHIQHFAGKKTSIFIPIIKASLSNYCTLQEMQKTMLLTVEAYFTSLFVNDKLGRQVYEMRQIRRPQQRSLVAVAVKSIEAALESKSLTNQTIRQGMKGMITCLSNFYTREKMLEYMTSSTGLTAKQAEHLFNRHIGNDAVRREAYHKRAAMSAGIHAREKQAAAEPAKGGDPVPEIIKGLECDLKALANQKIQVIFQSLKTCLSQYYTLEEMKTHMSAAVEQYYTSLFVDDKLGREAYLEKSLRRAPARRHEAEEAAALLQSEEEAMASKLASQVTKELQDHIETNNDQGSRKMMECMITCLSSYFTLKEMQIYMSSRTDFQATSVEIWYTKQLAQRDPAAHEAYVAVSSRMESLRAQQQQHASTSYSGGEGK
ncbi:hypothetical protein HID58_010157 [Brassica napus]|uniref:Uncharacterized protein n=1 Tax=Brassica napus TaxID=3708 RepID=A0ABQ8DX50_BRANA|nr:hypothetical protein HID58_010157 [Brassica napus]